MTLLTKLENMKSDCWKLLYDTVGNDYQLTIKDSPLIIIYAPTFKALEKKLDQYLTKLL